MQHHRLFAGLLASSLLAAAVSALQINGGLGGPQRTLRGTTTTAAEGANAVHSASRTATPRLRTIRPPLPKPDYARPRTYPSNGFPWPHFPITVSFDSSWAAHPANRTLTIAGFNQWVTATQGRVQYRLVSGRATDITVHFNPRLECGYTDTDCENQNGIRRLLHADMHLGGVDAGRLPIPPDIFQAAAAHEFGHALGIIQHSPYSSDLMFPELRNQMNVSPRDLATINKIYGW